MARSKYKSLTCSSLSLTPISFHSSSRIYCTAVVSNMSLFAPVPKPASLLGYHRLLSPTAGVRVSPLCLGAMNFGDAWEGFMGKCDKATAFEMLGKMSSVQK